MTKTINFELLTKHLEQPEKQVVRTPVENKEIYLLDNYRQEDFEGRTYFANLRLLEDEEMLDFLYKKRGITRTTVEKVKIGIEEDRTWRIPTFRYSTDGKRQVMGFEYRPKDLSKVGLCREKNTPTGLAMINEYTENTEVLVIVEGYFDGYALLQHLNEQGIDEYYHILTPSNGVNSLYKYIPQIDFNKYKKHILFLDNDEAGENMSIKIKEAYPMFKIIKLVDCNCKDFNEHYLKCIKAHT